jgi:hypothetical protein
MRYSVVVSHPHSRRCHHHENSKWYLSDDEGEGVILLRPSFEASVVLWSEWIREMSHDAFSLILMPPKNPNEASMQSSHHGSFNHPYPPDG